MTEEEELNMGAGNPDVLGRQSLEVRSIFGDLAIVATLQHRQAS
jgi:hypothetical protein